MTEILCCCKPENSLGTIGKSDAEKLGLQLKEWEDENGSTGIAYSSGDRPLSDFEQLPTFQAATASPERRTWKKRWKKTWKKD